MRYLIDTNVFMNEITDSIIDVAKFCKNENCGMYISPTILRELEPPVNSNFSNGCFNVVNNCINGVLCNKGFIQMVEISKEAREEYKRIRSRHYRWIEDPDYLKKMMDEGKLTLDEIKSIRYKDVGECELLAVAKTEKKAHEIVTDDLGRVYKHPFYNIFEYYKDDDKIQILSSENWLSKIGYK